LTTPWQNANRKWKLPSHPPMMARWQYDNSKGLHVWIYSDPACLLRTALVGFVCRSLSNLWRWKNVRLKLRWHTSATMDDAYSSFRNAFKGDGLI
jgi:hypothetical protein